MNMASNSGLEFSRHRREALERLLEMTTLLGEGMEADTAGRGLTVARAEVVWLVHHRGPMRQRDLADALRVSPRNVSGLLDALEATGFVSRTSHPSDRRATLIQLTEKGAAAAGALASDQAEFARYLFGDLSRAELDRFLETAGKLLGRLRDRSYADLRQAALKRWAAQNPATAPGPPIPGDDQRTTGPPPRTKAP
jgi:DNA-binding MarR family transcriptional regulator